MTGSSIPATARSNRRGIISRRGHRLVFHESDTKSGIVLRSSDDKLNLSINETEMQIAVRSDGTIEIEATGDISVKCQANITIEATRELTLKGATVKIAGSGPVDIDGSPIQLN